MNGSLVVQKVQRWRMGHTTTPHAWSLIYIVFENVAQHREGPLIQSGPRIEEATGSQGVLMTLVPR